jgi:hypothetical protein
VPPTCLQPVDRTLITLRLLWASLLVFALGELAFVLSVYWFSAEGVLLPLAAEPILPLGAYVGSAAFVVASCALPRLLHARSCARLMRQARCTRELVVMSYRDAGPSLLRFRDPDAALGALASRYAARIALALALVVPLMIVSLGALDARGWNGGCMCYGPPCVAPAVISHPLERAPILGLALVLIGAHVPTRREMLGELAGCFARSP